MPRFKKIHSSFQSCSHCISKVYIQRNDFKRIHAHTQIIERDIMHTYVKKRICTYVETFFRSFQDAMSAIHKYAYILVFT